MLRRLFGGQDKVRKTEPQVRAEMAETGHVMLGILRRGEVADDLAKPWRDRRTTRPAGLDPIVWLSWTFELAEAEQEGEQCVWLYPECVGQIFPDDWIVVGDEYRRVVFVDAGFDMPFVMVSPERRPRSAGPPFSPAV